MTQSSASQKGNYNAPELEVNSKHSLRMNLLRQSYWRLRLEGQGHLGHRTDSRKSVSLLRWSVLCCLPRRDPGGRSSRTLPSKHRWRGVLSRCCLTRFALGSWFTHAELRPETHPSILARWDTACCRQTTEHTTLKKRVAHFTNSSKGLSIQRRSIRQGVPH